MTLGEPRSQKIAVTGRTGVGLVWRIETSAGAEVEQ